MRWYSGRRFAAWPESLGPEEDIPASADVPQEKVRPRPYRPKGMSYKIHDSGYSFPTIIGTLQPPNAYDVFSTFEECKEALMSELEDKLERLNSQIETLRMTKEGDISFHN